jgi:tetratricopeptide (TPR) repeat protein
VQAVVAKLLAPDPSARYDTARGIREDLERAVAGHQTSAESEGWPARARDEAQTRRTRPPMEMESEATRRTSQPSAPTPPVVPPPIPRATASVVTPPPLPRSTKPVPRRRRWLRRLVPLALLILVLRSVGNEMSVGSAADELTTSIPTRELDELADAWDQYDELARRGLGSRASALERSLVEHTDALANAVIENYRMPRPSVREAQWRAARDALARAVAFVPEDQRLKAALRYCEGHLRRINGEARKARKQFTAEQELNEAVKAFREAAELRPGWPDPFLGLARTFIYGLEDVDRGADALAQAERHGHIPADREMAQLGDGYRLRAETLARSARHVAGMSQERDYLTRAADAYRESIAHYSKASDYGNVARNLGVAQRRLDQVQERIATIDDPQFEELRTRSAEAPAPDRRP